jgi:putative transposase
LRINRKRVHWLWRRPGLRVPQKARNNRFWATAATVASACARAQGSIVDVGIILDRWTNGRSLKRFSVVDEYTRERLAWKVNRRMTSCEAIDLLADLLVLRGVSGHMRSDSGPEFIAQPGRFAAGWTAPK